MTDPGPDDADERDGDGSASPADRVDGDGSASPADRVDGDRAAPQRDTDQESPKTDPGSSEHEVQGHAADRDTTGRPVADHDGSGGVAADRDTPAGQPDDHDTTRGRPDSHGIPGDDRDPSSTIGVGGDHPEAGAVGQRDAESDDEEWLFVARDLLVTVLAVLLVGGYLFAISGVWPPMVAIESGSMEPNMNVNDMVFIVEEQRFQPADATGNTGVVTAQVGAETGYGQFGGSGDVIIFEPGGNGATTPIIHRAMFWVEEGENWCEMADPAYLGRFEATDQNCVAPHEGFITKGDANPRYDQASFGESGRPVKPEWIVGTAELRIPRLGWFRLQL